MVRVLHLVLVTVLAALLAGAQGDAERERLERVRELARDLAEPEFRTDALAELGDLFAIVRETTLPEDMEGRIVRVKTSIWCQLLLDAWAPADVERVGSLARARADLEGSEYNGVIWARSVAIWIGKQHLQLHQPELADLAADWGRRFEDRWMAEAEQEGATGVGLRRLKAHVAFARGEFDSAAEWIDETRAFAERSGVPGLRARAAAGNAELLRRMGVTDAAAEELREAFAALERDAGGAEQPLGPEHLIQADLWLTNEQFATVEQQVGAWLERDAIVPAVRHHLEIQRGLALLELEREDPHRERVAEALLAQRIDAEASPPATAVATVSLQLAGAALRREDTDATRGHLTRTREALGEAVAAGMETETAQLLAAYEARLAVLTDAPLEDARRATSSAVAALLEAWDTVPARPAGGIAFLHDPRRRQVLCSALDVIFGQAARELAAITVPDDATDDERAACEASAEEIDQRAFEDALNVVLRAQSRGTLAQGLGLSGTIDLAELRRDYLQPGQGVLVLLPSSFDDGSHILAFDAERSMHRRFGSHASLRPAVRALAREFRGPPDETDPADRAWRVTFVKSQAVLLRDALLAEELREWIRGWSAVTFVGAELLGPVCLDLLELDEGTPLGRAKAVDYLSSLHIGLHLAREGFPTELEHEHGLVAALVGGGEFLGTGGAGGEPSTRLLEREALDALGEAYGEAPRWSLINEDATLDALRERAPALSGTLIVEFLVHGDTKPHGERRAALVLHGDAGGRALLDCEWVEDHLAAPGVVLLHSCGAGRASARPGDDNPASLAGALVRHGTRAVLSTRSPIELRRAQAQSAELHRALAAGASLAEAVRRARVALADQDGDELDQLYDLQLQVYGLGQVPVRPR